MSAFVSSLDWIFVAGLGMLSMSIALNAVLSSRRCATPGTIPRRCSSLRSGNLDLSGNRLRGIPLLQLVCCFAGPRVCRIDHEEGIRRVCIAGVGCFHYSCVHLLAKYIFVRILPGSRYSTGNTINHWVTWLGCNLGHHIHCIHNCEYNPGL